METPLYNDFSSESIFRPEYEPSFQTFTLQSLANAIKDIQLQRYNLFENKNLSPNQNGFIKDYGETMADYTFPEFFSPEREMLQRYQSSPMYPTLGFVPGRDNEEIYGLTQSNGEKIANGFSQMWELTKYQFVDQLKGWGRLFDFNPIGEDIEEVNKNLDRIMNQSPIFMTESDRESTFNWSKFANVIGQTGFTLGMAGEILFEEAVLTGLNALSGGALTGLQSARTIQLLGKAAGLSKRMSQYLKTIYKINDKILDAGTVRNIYQRIGQKAIQFTPFTNTLETLVKGSRLGENTLQYAGRTFGAFYRDLREANAVFTEARAEAAGTKHEMLQKLKDDYYEKYGVDAPYEKIQEFERLAEEASTANFISNALIIGASNRIMFDNLFRGFKGVSKYIGETGEILQDSKGFFAKGIGLRTAKAMLRTAPLTYFKNNITEALQESLQSSSNEAVQAWYIGNYNNPNSTSVFEAIKKGIGSQFSQEGIDTFLAGFATGSIAGPIQGGAMWIINRLSTSKEDRQKRRDLIAERVAKLNQFFTFNDKNNLPKQIQLANAMVEAAKAGSKKDFYDIKDQVLRDFVRTAVETNKIDAMFEMLDQSIRDLTEEEFKDAYGVETTKKDLLASIAEMKNRAEVIKNIKEELDYQLPTNYNSTNPSAYEEAKWHVAFMRHAGLRVQERIQSIQNEIKSNPELGKITFNAFQILIDPNHLEKQLNLLKDAEKLNEDPKRNRILKRQIKTLELIKERGITPALFRAHLENFSDAKIPLSEIEDSFEKIKDILLLKEDEAKYIDNLDYLADPNNFQRFLAEHIKHSEATAVEKGVLKPEEVSDEVLEVLKYKGKRFKRSTLQEFPEIEDVNGVPVRKKLIDEYAKRVSKVTSPSEIPNVIKELFGDEKPIKNDEESKFLSERNLYYRKSEFAKKKIRDIIEKIKENPEYNTGVERAIVEEAREIGNPEVDALIEEYFDLLAENKLKYGEVKSYEEAYDEIFSEFPEAEVEEFEGEVFSKSKEESEKEPSTVTPPIPTEGEQEEESLKKQGEEPEEKGFVLATDLKKGDKILLNTREGNKVYTVSDLELDMDGSVHKIETEEGEEIKNLSELFNKDPKKWKLLKVDISEKEKEIKEREDIARKSKEVQELEKERDEKLKELEEELKEAEKLLRELEQEEEEQSEEEKKGLNEATQAIIDETLDDEEKQVVSEVAKKNKKEGQSDTDFVREQVQDSLKGKETKLKGPKSLIERFKKIIRKIVSFFLIVGTLWTTSGPVSDFLARHGIVSREKTQFIMDFAGKTDDITERSLSESQLDLLREIIKNAERKGRSYVTYNDYPNGNLGVRQFVRGKEEEKIFFTDDETVIKRLLGRFTFKKVDGNYIISDQYNFDDAQPGKNIVEKIKNVAEILSKPTNSPYGKIRYIATQFLSPEGKGSIVKIVIPENKPKDKSSKKIFSILPLAFLASIRRKKENGETITKEDIENLKKDIEKIKEKIQEVKKEYSVKIAEVIQKQIQEEEKLKEQKEQEQELSKQEETQEQELQTQQESGLQEEIEPKKETEEPKEQGQEEQEEKPEQIQQKEQEQQKQEKEQVEQEEEQIKKEEKESTLPSSGLVFKLTRNISAYWISEEKIWRFYNNKGKEVTSKSQLKKYTKLFSQKANKWFMTWFFHLLEEKHRERVLQIFDRAYYLLEKGFIEISEYHTEYSAAMTVLYGMKFKPSEHLIKDLTDVSPNSKWFSKDGAHIDTYAMESFIEEMLEYGIKLDEYDAIELIKEVIRRNPKGITKKAIKEEMDSNNPSRELLSLEFDFMNEFGLDLFTFINENEDIQEIISEYKKKKDEQSKQEAEETDDEQQQQPDQEREQGQYTEEQSPINEGDPGSLESSQSLEEDVKQKVGPQFGVAREIDEIPIDDPTEVIFTTITNELSITEKKLKELRENLFRVNENGEPDINGKTIEALGIEDYAFFVNTFIRKIFQLNLEDEYKFIIYRDNDDFYKHYNHESYTGIKFKTGNYTYKGERKGLVIILSDKDGNPIYLDRNFNQTTSDKGVLITLFLPRKNKSEIIEKKRKIIESQLSLLPEGRGLELELLNINIGGYEKYIDPKDYKTSYNALEETGQLEGIIFSTYYKQIAKGKVELYPMITLKNGSDIVLQTKRLSEGIVYNGEVIDVQQFNGYQINFKDFNITGSPEKQKEAKERIIKLIKKSLMNIVPAEVNIKEDGFITFNYNPDNYLYYNKSYIKDKFPVKLPVIRNGKLTLIDATYTSFLLQNSKIYIIPLQGEKKKIYSLINTSVNFRLPIVQKSMQVNSEKPQVKRLPRDVFDKVVSYLENNNIIIEKICK